MGVIESGRFDAMGVGANLEKERNKLKAEAGGKGSVRVVNALLLSK
jgi:hypothetical protein